MKKKLLNNIFILSLIILFIYFIITYFKKVNNSKEQYFKGFVLYNPKTKKELINYNGDKYFTPASNVKLFTFFTALKVLKDSVKSLAYYKTNDSLIIKGTADPSLLYGFKSNKTLDFLKKENKKIYLLDESIDEPYYGKGWSWDDYQNFYMPEKNLFPIYGNILSYYKNNDCIVCYPKFFEKNIQVLDSLFINREFAENQFYIENSNKGLYKVPFKTSNNLVAELLEREINKKISIIPWFKKTEFKYLKTFLYNDLYKQMLKKSDNFIAEQLMLQVGKEVSNLYSVDYAIKYSLNNYLINLPQKPYWVDGSGLSRYNLFTPKDIVYVLDLIYEEIPLQKILDFFPIVDIYKNGSTEDYYIYAKSGTSSNTCNLSGYLRTKKGTILIFSYMVNHHRLNNSKINKEILLNLMKVINKY